MGRERGWTGWPFVGRERELEAVTGRLLERRRAEVAVLRGPAGVGKTALARAIGRRLAEHGRFVVHLHANTALSSVPFGVLAPLLVALDIDPVDEPDQAVGLLAAIHRRAASRPDLALVLDDVTRADPGSLAAIDGVVRTAGLAAVLTARTSESLPPVVGALIDGGLAHEVVVDPFTRTETDALLLAALGEDVDPDTSRVLFTESGGNPLFLRELVHGARESGSIESGPHGLRVVDVVPSGRLIDRIGARFAGIEGPTRDTLELLAAGEPLAVDQLDVDAVDRLVRDGLATTMHERTTAVARLAHPLYGEVLRSLTPPHRWRCRLVDAAELIGKEPDGVLRSVVLQLEAEMIVPVDDLVAAARQAHHLLDHRLAVDLAERAERHASSAELPAAALVRGAALSALGQLEEAEAVLGDALERAVADGDIADGDIAAAAKALGQHLAVRAARPSDAVDVLDGVLDGLVDPAARALLDADRVRWAMLGGHEVEQLATVPGEDGPSRLNVRMTEALIAVMGGPLSEARRAVDEALLLAEVHADELSHAPDLLRLTRCMASLYAGDLATARTIATTHLDDGGARQDEASGMWAYALSAIDLHAGRATDALHWSELAVTRLRWRDFTGLVATAEAMRATALAQLGRLGEARAGLTDHEEPETDVWAALQRAQARTWLAAASRHRSELAAAVDELRAATDRGTASGHRYLAAFAAYTAVRVGHPEPVVDDLDAMVPGSEGLLVPTMAHHARALAANDPDALQSSADQLAHLGLRTAAADALDQAATALSRRGRAEAARRSTLRARHLAEGFDGARWRGPLGDEAHGRLTARELEVAQLASRRHRSREIAADLGLSVRTIDNHLGRIFRKLEVANRDELAGALRSIGLLEPDQVP